jgi:hypothetical protein
MTVRPTRPFRVPNESSPGDRTSVDPLPPNQLRTVDHPVGQVCVPAGFVPLGYRSRPARTQ